MTIFKSFKKMLAIASSIALTSIAILPTEARADALLDGRIYAGEVAWITLRDMTPGRRFNVYGTCDSDCSDMDFRLYDGNDNLIDSDLLYDDFPIVSATPRWEGNFYLKVSIPSCSTFYCNYDIYIDD